MECIKEQKAETEVQQSKTAESLPSAPLAAIPMLGAVYHNYEKEKHYYLLDISTTIVNICGRFSDFRWKDLVWDI